MVGIRGKDLSRVMSRGRGRVIDRGGGRIHYRRERGRRLKKTKKDLMSLSFSDTIFN